MSPIGTVGRGMVNPIVFPEPLKDAMGKQFVGETHHPSRSVDYLPLTMEIRVNKKDVLTKSQLIELWNDILEIQRTGTLKGAEEQGGLGLKSDITVSDARDLVEDEMKRRGIELNFKLYYANYLQQKREGRYIPS